MISRKKANGVRIQGQCAILTLVVQETLRHKWPLPLLKITLFTMADKKGRKSTQSVLKDNVPFWVCLTKYPAENFHFCTALKYWLLWVTYFSIGNMEEDVSKETLPDTVAPVDSFNYLRSSRLIWRAYFTVKWKLACLVIWKSAKQIAKALGSKLDGDTGVLGCFDESCKLHNSVHNQIQP